MSIPDVLSVARGTARKPLTVLAAVVVLLVCLHGLSTGSITSGNAEVGGLRGYVQSAFKSTSTDTPDRYVRLGPTASTIRQTEFLQGVPGYSLFDNLYFKNGTLFFVSDQPEDHSSRPPPIEFVMSEPPRDDGSRHGPRDLDFQFLSIEEARSVLGTVAVRLAGNSVLLNDQTHPKSYAFMGHYFHFAETFLGAWRLLAVQYAVTEGRGTTAGMKTPQRLMFRTAPDDWRDHAKLTSWFISTIMPDSHVESRMVWQDRAESQTTFVFDRITITDRFAAHRFGGLNAVWNKMSAELIKLEGVTKDWIQPLRDNIVRLGTAAGYAMHREHRGVPIVTYINRQNSGRSLQDDDAERVLERLMQLDADGIIELYNAYMEDLSKSEQFCLAAKTDIMLGVHGNGLSHQLWMKPGGNVIEASPTVKGRVRVMDIGGFAMDYALPADLIGHNYYAIHNDTVFTRDKWLTSDGWGAPQSPGFHGGEIRLDAGFIGDLVQKIAKEGDYTQ